MTVIEIKPHRSGAGKFLKLWVDQRQKLIFGLRPAVSLLLAALHRAIRCRSVRLAPRTGSWLELMSQPLISRVGAQLEVPLLAEPFECALQVSTIYFVTTTESAQADVLKTGANQRTFDLLLLRRGCDTIVNSAADPNRQTQKSGRRGVGFQRLWHLVFIDSAEEKSANVQGVRLG